MLGPNARVLICSLLKFMLVKLITVEWNVCAFCVLLVFYKFIVKLHVHSDFSLDFPEVMSR
jgi:hypothetical protein